VRISEITVQAGSPRITWCDTCQTNAHVTFDMHVLSADGPVVVGTSSGCGQCRTGFFADDKQPTTE
jgi:hypothetical protein